MVTTKKAEKELATLPDVSGRDFAVITEAFRDFILAQQDNHHMVTEVLVDLIGWTPEQAQWVVAVLNGGVEVIHPEVTDPLAEMYRKDTATVVRRTKNGD